MTDSRARDLVGRAARFLPALRVSLFVRSAPHASYWERVHGFRPRLRGLHALLATGGRLTPDDRDLIVFSGSELLSNLKAA
jgi:hypothetical protein